MTGGASPPIAWILEMTVVPGQLGERRPLMTEMVGETHAYEPGAPRDESWPDSRRASSPR
jgi:hypothetical protein